MKRVIFVSFFAMYVSLGVAQESPWQREFDQFAELDSIEPPSREGVILFTGSSSIRFWKNPQQDFNNPNIINRGFGGSKIQDLIKNFDLVIKQYNPETIVIYSGDNDIASGISAERVYGNFCQLMGMISSNLPDTKVVYIAIKPSLARWGQALEMQKANNLINDYLNGKENGNFADVYSVMIGKDGKPGAEYFIADGLHMTTAGYALWTEVLAPFLKTE